MRTVRPNRNTIDVLHLHDNARPPTILHPREAVAKIGWTFLLIALTGQVWHPRTATCLAVWSLSYVDAILQMAMNWNEVFVLCSEVEVGDCTTVDQSVLLNVGRSALKMTETSLKNSLIISKVLQLYFLRKKLETTSVPLVVIDGNDSLRIWSRAAVRIRMSFAYGRSQYQMQCL
jgi:hypothetical protein